MALKMSDEPAPQQAVIEQIPQRAPVIRRKEDVALTIALILIDIAMIDSSFILAYYFRMSNDITGRFVAPSTTNYVFLLAVLTVMTLGVFQGNHLYDLKRGRSKIDEFYKVAAAVTIGVVLAVAIGSFVLADQFVYSRQVLVVGWLTAIVLITLARLLFGMMLGRLRKRGFAQATVLIVGAGETGQMLLEKIENDPASGYRVAGFLDDNKRGIVGSVPVLGSTSDLVSAVRRRGVDEVIYCVDGASHQQILDFIIECEDEAVSIRLLPDAFQIISNNEIGVGELGGLPLINVRDVRLKGLNRVIKRIVDVIFSLGVLVFTSPLMMFLAFLIKITSPGPVFYVQERVGMDGKSIQVLKYRSMRVGAEKETGPVWAKKNDPRRTKIGAFMRRFSLDELPQFINVLIGDMSIVGPRPERPHFVEQFSQTIPRYMRRHKEKAGLTGWAQVNGLRGDTSIEERTRYDLYYIENWSLLLDFKIMVRTIVAIFRDQNAY